jgi:hypothetical protein
VGTWRSACSANGGGFEQEVVTITKSSATQFSISFDGKSFPTSACATGTTSFTGSGTATINPTTKTTTSAETVDRLDVSVTACSGPPGDCPATLPAAEKWIALATSTTLRIGFDPAGADGYPPALQDTYTKL